MSWSFYKRDAHAFFYATRTLNIEDRGAFNDLLDLMYIHDGKLVDDDKFFKAALGISGQKWGAIKRRLINAEKIICEDGLLWNDRALREINQRSKSEKKHREVAEKSPRSQREVSEKLPRSQREGAEKLEPVSLKNKDLADDSPRVHAREDIRYKIKEEETPLPPLSENDPLELNPYSRQSGYQIDANGMPVVINGTRQEWIKKFGSEEILDAALVEISDPPIPKHSVDKTIASRLARMHRLQAEREKDRNARNSRTSNKHSTPLDREEQANRAFMEEMKRKYLSPERRHA